MAIGFHLHGDEQRMVEEIQAAQPIRPAASEVLRQAIRELHARTVLEDRP